MNRTARAGGVALSLVALATAGLVAGCAGRSGTTTLAAARQRNARWAVPLGLEDLPNGHKVSGDLYRGAQPAPEGIRELKRLGVKTIVNLRLLHSDRDEIKKAGLDLDGGDIGYERIKMEAWDADEDEVVRFLKVMADPARRPVFVHCKHGADRTGTMCAVYRVVFQGWSKEDAVDEMRNGGYGFHSIWRGLPKFVMRMDVEKMKRDAGIAD